MCTVRHLGDRVLAPMQARPALVLILFSFTTPSERWRPSIYGTSNQTTAPCDPSCQKQSYLKRLGTEEERLEIPFIEAQVIDRSPVSDLSPPHLLTNIGDRCSRVWHLGPIYRYLGSHHMGRGAPRTFQDSLYSMAEAPPVSLSIFRITACSTTGLQSRRSHTVRSPLT